MKVAYLISVSETLMVFCDLRKLVASSPYWNMVKTENMKYINLHEGDLQTGTVIAINSIIPNTTRTKKTGNKSLNFSELFTSFRRLIVCFFNLVNNRPFLLKSTTRWNANLLLNLFTNHDKLPFSSTFLDLKAVNLSLLFMLTHDNELHNREFTELTTKELQRTTCKWKCNKKL